MKLSDTQRIIQGQFLESAQYPPPATPVPHVSGGQNGAECRAYSPTGDLVAILAFDPAISAWRPRKVFAA